MSLPWRRADCGVDLFSRDGLAGDIGECGDGRERKPHDGGSLWRGVVDFFNARYLEEALGATDAMQVVFECTTRRVRS